MSEPILEMKQINKGFPGVQALSDVDFTVNRGEVHCLIGANGAGKSTLMKILAGAYPKDSGTVTFDGVELKNGNTLDAKKNGISVIYQELSLVNELSVTENILINNMPRKFGKIDWKESNRIAQRLVDQLNLNIDVHAKAGELSIGSRQLVELMKCLACDSKLIVMDEPSATLTSREVESLIRIVNGLREKGVTVIYISHKLEEVLEISDRVSVMRDGKLAARAGSSSSSPGCGARFTAVSTAVCRPETLWL